ECLDLLLRVNGLFFAQMGGRPVALTQSRRCFHQSIRLRIWASEVEPVLRDIPNSRHTSNIDSLSSRRLTKRGRSSITELAFHGIYTSPVKSAGKWNPCVRYEMEPVSRAAHNYLEYLACETEVQTQLATARTGQQRRGTTWRNSFA